MKTFKIKDFKLGWLVGNFEPSLFKNEDIEIAIHYYDENFKYDNHFHKEVTEYNIVIKGKAILPDIEINEGEGWIYLPGDKSIVKYTENTILLIIKTPSRPLDKFYN